MKLFYENKRNASAAVREFRYVKNLLRGSLSAKGILTMIKRFEETEKLGVQPGRNRKPVTPVLADADRTAVTAHSQRSKVGESRESIAPFKNSSKTVCTTSHKRSSTPKRCLMGSNHKGSHLQFVFSAE